MTIHNILGFLLVIFALLILVIDIGLFNNAIRVVLKENNDGYDRSDKAKNY